MTPSRGRDIYTGMTARSVDEVRRLIMGFRTTQLLYVAARLGIADKLADGPHDACTLASAVGAHPRALYRLMRALASVGLFTETADRRFELTPLGQTLRRDAPGSLRDVALIYGDEWVWSAYGSLSHSVMTGRPAFEHVHGQTFYHYLRNRPDAAATFDRAMTAFSDQEAAAILEAYDFSGASTLVDIGAGQGALMAAILRAYPDARAILFDQTAVVEHALQVAAAAGVTARVTIAPGDFFERVPAGGDLYLLKSVLHNWEDPEAIDILRNCRDVMSHGSRLLIVERVVPDSNASSEAKLFDINMLVVSGGLERTATEYENVLAAAGFELSRVIATQAAVSILESVPRS
jgi:tRNA A58 N-methylase Trm61